MKKSILKKVASTKTKVKTGVNMKRTSGPKKAPIVGAPSGDTRAK